MKVTRPLVSRWRRENGYRQVLVVAIPLVLSTGSWSIQHFVDRMFLTWYSAEAMAAALPAGQLNFAIMSFFMGTATYVNTFVAQYYGAGRHERVGPSIWQAIYVALIGGAVLLAMVPPAGAFFDFIGHEASVREYETTYFQVLCMGATPAIAASAMAGFFSGRGRTWPVLWINVFATVVNLVLDYAMIFGHWGFPEMGIKGAALATVLSGCTRLVIYLAILFRPSYAQQYHTLKGWRPDPSLFARLIRFGFPNGVQFFIDMAAFTTFVLIMGRLGTAVLAATNIAFNINTLAFMPMIGCGIAVSVLVGQSLGRDRPDMAERAVYSGAHLTFLYMTTLALLYVLVPNLFLAPFAAQADADDFAPISTMAVIFLRFVAIYSVFDTLNIVFASGIKGAGDTRFVMSTVIVLSLLALMLPSYVGLVLLNGGVYVGFGIVTAYVSMMGLVFLFRFLGGKWKSMRVIETTPIPPPQATSENPTSGLGS